MKIHVNENIEAALALGAENDARVELQHIENRVEEKEDLESENKLDAETESSLNAMISTSKNDFDENTIELEKDSTQANVAKNLR